MFKKERSRLFSRAPAMNEAWQSKFSVLSANDKKDSCFHIKFYASNGFFCSHEYEGFDDVVL